MSSEFDAEFKAFSSRNVNRIVKKFWDLYNTINLDEEDRKEWCITSHYGLSLRNVFEAIEDNDWKDIKVEIEKVNTYA